MHFKDFVSYIDSGHLDKVGFEHRDGKLRIVLANVGARSRAGLIKSGSYRVKWSVIIR